MGSKVTASDSREIPSAEGCAQAAAWMAKLHGVERDAALEAGFRQWLAADSLHRTAFEMANEIWDEAERWPRPVQTPSLPERRHAWSVPRFAAAAAVLVLVLISGVL